MVDEYVLDTILLPVPGVATGVRARTPLDANYCELVTAHLKRGGVFGAGLSFDSEGTLTDI